MKDSALSRLSLIGMILLSCTAYGQNHSLNVRDYGATGKKSQNARPFIQRTIDSCAASGGGMVYLPPGDYSSGTLPYSAIPVDAAMSVGHDPVSSHRLRANCEREFR